MTTVAQALKMPPNHVEKTDGPIDIVGVADYNARWNRCSDADQVKEAAIDEAMDRMADVLGAPDYTGDYQTALIHHMGRSAFDGFDNLRQSIESAKEIEESRPAAGIIPVILNYDSRIGERRFQNMTAFLAVDPKQPFRSKVVHETDVQQGGFIEPISVTTRKLSIVGRATVIDRDLAGLSMHSEGADNRHFRIESFEDEFVVRQITQKDPHNRKLPRELPTYRQLVSVRRDREENFDHFINRYLRTLVGWNEISERLFGHMPQQQAALGYIKHVVRFFDEAGQLDALRKHSPDMAKSIDLSTEIVAKFAELGTPAKKSGK